MLKVFNEDSLTSTLFSRSCLSPSICSHAVLVLHCSCSLKCSFLSGNKNGASSSCRLCEKDPYQLYQRLEQQAREYVLEMKVRLLKHLSAGSKTTGSAGGVAAAQGPPQAHQFISLLLEEYNALCQAARTISSFLLTLVSRGCGVRSPAGGVICSLIFMCNHGSFFPF